MLNTPPKHPMTGPEIGAVIMLTVFFGAMMAVGLFEDFSVYKLSVPFFIVSWVLLLIIHEFGHALMAKAVRWRVIKVSIGTGKLVTEKKIFGMQTEFRAIPLSGYAQQRPTDLNRPQLKNFLIYAAGPGSEILLIGLIWLLIGNDLFDRQPLVWLIAVQSFCSAATFGAVITLIPFAHENEQKKKIPSDGLGMIIAWQIPTEEYAKAIDKRLS